MPQSLPSLGFWQGSIPNSRHSELRKSQSLMHLANGTADSNTVTCTILEPTRDWLFCRSQYAPLSWEKHLISEKQSFVGRDGASIAGHGIQKKTHGAQ
jgi:hypothetical protein